MKIFISIFLLFILSKKTSAFTLTSASPAHFPSDSVKVKVTNNDCVRVGDGTPSGAYTKEKLLSLVKIAVENFWMEVPTHRLELEVDGIFSQAMAATPPSSGENTIIVGCQTTGLSAGVLGVGGSSSSGGKIISSVVQLNDQFSFASMNEDQEWIATIVHEIGHTLEIGHSKIRYAVMFGENPADVRTTHLAQDDYDAITYLYPNEKLLVGFFGNCLSTSIIMPNKKDYNDFGTSALNGYLNIFFGVMLAMVISMILKLIRAKIIPDTGAKI